MTAASSTPPPAAPLAAASQAPAQAPTPPPPRGARPPWRRHLLGWLAGAAAMWLGTWLLVRGLLAPAAAATGTAGVVPNAMFATTWGLLLLALQPVALAWSLSGRARERPAAAAAWRTEAALAVYGLAWLAGFALLAAATLAGFWRASPLAGGPPVGLAAAWWMAWGGLWLGVWLGGRWSGLPANGLQAGVAAAAVAVGTAVLWLNPLLARLADESARLAAIAAVVWTSPMHGWVSGVLGLDFFRTGGMYHPPTAGGESHSIIGDYAGSLSHWPTAAEHMALFAALGAVAALSGFGIFGIRRLVARQTGRVGRGQSCSTPGSHSSRRGS